MRYPLVEGAKSQAPNNKQGPNRNVQIPIAKHQPPNKHQTSTTKLPNPQFEFWELEFWLLEFSIWLLEFPHQGVYQMGEAMINQVINE